jgi:hypothetical protein
MGDSSDNSMFINEQIHKNAQATTVLLASLCREEYKKVSGLDNAKQIWETLKISHEGNDATVTPQVLPWPWHIYALMTVITCGRDLRRRA